MFARLSGELFVSADELLGRYDYGTPNLIREAKAEYFAEPRYSVADYFDLPEQGDYELIDGKLVKKMPPGTGIRSSPARSFLCSFIRISGHIVRNVK